ncbi:GvpL/GvpF family gas vesicle protein [Candidatus Gracilibacteria bacterium]|nr:GvpL/GvpF family gas vesicle protein [Candidatus Gracilibacteria bacterium]
MYAVYLYAIQLVKHGLPADLAGIDGAALRLVQCDELAAVVSEIQQAPDVRELPAILAHELAVETLMASRCVLPVRFGTVLSDERAVRSLLAHHELAFRTDLTRLDGCVELGLRALWRSDGAAPAPAEPDVPSPLSAGRRYLEGRRQVLRQEQHLLARATAISEQLHAALDPLVRAAVVRRCRDAQTAVTASYLVERGDIGSFRSALGDLSAVFSEVQLLCTGPWPPYSFVSTRSDGQ